VEGEIQEREGEFLGDEQLSYLAIPIEVGWV